MDRKVSSYLFLVILLLSLLPLASPNVGATLSYYGSGWTQRKTITIDHTKVNVNLPDFPMLFKNTSYDYRVFAKTNGYDFVFTDAAGVKLSHEIENYNSSTGELVAWVKIPLISSTVDTVIYLYYGNSSAVNQEDTVNVWDSHYLGVWHMNETTGEITDSTSYNNNFTTATATYTKTANTIGNARYFDTAADRLVTTYIYPSMSAYTLDCWYNHSSIVSGAVDEMMDIKVNDPSIFRDASNKLQLYSDGGFIGTSISTFNNINWHYMSYGNTGSAMSLFIDRVRENNTAGAHDSGNNILCIGDNGLGSDTFLGYVDEARISDISRNWSYHNATYNNFNSPATFYSVSFLYSGSYHIRLYPSNDYQKELERVDGSSKPNWEALKTLNFLYGLPEDADVVINPTAGAKKRDIYAVDDLPNTQMKIANVSISMVSVNGGAGVGDGYQIGYYTHGLGNHYTHAWKISAGGLTHYENDTYYITINGLTGSTFIPDEINNMYIDLYDNRSAAEAYNHYSMWVDVYYYPCPVNLSSVEYNATKVSLSWTKSNWGNTVITAKIGSTPTTWTDGVIVYNGSAQTGIATGLSPAKHYYFKSWSFNTTSLVYSIGNATSDCWTPPERITSNVYSNTKAGATNYVNITWVNATGLHHTRTVIRKSLVSQPILPTDGTGVYNGTGKPYFNETFALNYYTIFHYNGSITDTSKYSVGSNVSSYVFLLNCYNESSGVALTNWNVLISNATGSQIYQKINCNNSLIVSVGLMPSGAGCTITFSRANYTTRTYTQTIVKTGVYNITGYLAHFTIPTAPPVNTSYLYQLYVIDEKTSRVSDALIIVKRVIGGAFTPISSGFTDGNGQFNVYLIPGNSYLFIINKTGYINETSTLTVSSVIFDITFKLYTETVPPLIYDYAEEIHFNGYVTRSTHILHVNYTDDMTETVNAQIYVYEFNSTTNTTSLFASNLTVGDSHVYPNFSGINNQNTYIVILKHNHTVFFHNEQSFIIGKLIISITTPSYTNRLFNYNYGYNPFGWTNCIMFVILIIIIFYGGKEELPLVYLALGVIFLFLNVVVGLYTWSVHAGDFIPIMFIIAGVLTGWSRYRG
jgi:hypothetical protein